jgi:hypothetical protein
MDEAEEANNAVMKTRQEMFEAEEVQKSSPYR